MRLPLCLAAGLILSAAETGSLGLKQAHQGTVEIDTALLNLAPQPPAVQRFFATARATLAAEPQATFAGCTALRQAAQEQGIALLGGPMLGGISDSGALVWVRTVTPAAVTVKAGGRTFGPVASTAASDLTAVVAVEGLKPGSRTPYQVLIDGRPIPMPAEAAIATTGGNPVRFACGSCMHKTGLWNRPLLEQVRTRGNAALLLLGDSAVDDRNGTTGLHRSDYLLRDLSPAWRSTAAALGIYAVWDDHDYFNDDRSGIPQGFTDADRRAVREAFVRNWVNPGAGLDGQGLCFRTRIGPCDVIMLDTRYFREKGKDGGFLGQTQERWLLEQLADCKGPFVLLTSGTMWSDDISAGKDSWGTWDPAQRERILSFIEQKRIGGVLLASGDRHGARVLRLPRPSGFAFHEFEPASLGGHGGPPAMADDPSRQLFGLAKTPAFGEFSFDTVPADPVATFRLIGADGKVLYELALPRSRLTPGG